MAAKSKLLALLLVAFFVAASVHAREQRVTVSGSSTVMPLAELEAEEFNMLQDRYHVSVTSGALELGLWMWLRADPPLPWHPGRSSL